MRGNPHVRFLEGPGPATAPAYSTERDQLISMTSPEGWTLRYGWDEAGNRTSVTADLGDQGVHATSYTHDPLGRMATVTDARGGVYAYGYDAAGRQASLSYPNGVLTSWQHDAVGRMVGLRAVAPDETVIQDYAYVFGPAGNRRSVTEQDGTVRAWEYDELYRLTRERVTDGTGALVYENTFAYDPAGNRLEQVRTGADGTRETISYTYDARDRLLSEASSTGAVTSYGWDGNGNLVREEGPEGVRRYGWDFENRLLSVELPDGIVLENVYDADGVRMASRLTPAAGEPTVSTSWVTDTSGSLSQVIAELTETGSLDVQYARGGGLLGLLRANEERYTHADHLGSVRSLTESTATVADVYAYEAFGKLQRYAGDDPNPFLFAGQQREKAVGLDYLRARWMDPGTGRFLSVDPHPGEPEGPIWLNRYLFGRQNPVLRVDPSGQSSFSVGGLVAITVALVTLAVVASVDFSKPLNTIGGSRVSEVWVGFDSDFLAPLADRFAPLNQFGNPFPTAAEQARLRADVTNQIRVNLSPFGALVKSGWIGYSRLNNFGLGDRRQIHYRSGAIAEIFSDTFEAAGGPTFPLNPIVSIWMKGVGEKIPRTAFDLGSIAHAMADTGTHELGHALGIVGHYQEEGWFMSDFIDPNRPEKWHPHSKEYLRRRFNLK